MNITRDAYLSRVSKSTSSDVLRNFVYSLFEGGTNNTSVNVKEFYAERLSMKIDVLDSAIELKMEQK